ncbi:MAG: polysaccharide deacetylase family protein [Ignavibacterium album]|uniref:polysaccharide deacetylase family protein n=1 Tax=Ignavibacterium album TaxID=591197 RepID=UPI0026EDF66C|nr:polysaccharide deacetylase family protein [Ignavibacterium album]MCX8104461.1 polysaccharide deacetylase family protein [Ignavibacterium album]
MILIKSKIFGAAVILLILTQINLSAQSQNLIYLSKWFENKSSAFSFSFDDGLKSQFLNAKPILDQFDFKGTFYVLPNYLTDTEPTIWRYGTWQMFQNLASQNHEIGSHTLNHLYLTSLPIGDTSTSNSVIYELYHSKRIIEEKIFQQKCLTLAYPFADHNNSIDSVTTEYYESARAVGVEPNNYNLTEPLFYSLKSYPVHFSLPRNSPTDDLDELYAFMDWTQNSINQNAWAIMMVHEVVPFSELVDLVNQGFYEPMSNEWFTEYCNWLKNKSDNSEVWVTTVANVTKYIRQRQNSAINLISVTDSVIVFNLSDNLNDEIYNLPLTCLIKVPENWNAVYFNQNNFTDTLFAFQTDSGKFVQANVYPDRGFVLLKSIIVNSIDNTPESPNEFVLEQNYPNPFNPSARISWQSPIGSWQTIKLYDLLGREIETIVDGYYEAGYHSTLFIVNSSLPSGVYFYRLQAGNIVQTKKMMLLR